MEKIIVDSYKLNRISTFMAKDFGTIPKGDEELYSYPLSAMEGNLLKLHRQNSERTGRQAGAAIQMALLTVDAYIRQVVYDFDRFVTPANQVFLHGLLMSFDPYTNPGIHEVVMEDDSAFIAKEYYATPIKCLLRIQKSVQKWTDELGPNGYFIFIEGQMGSLVKQDNEMNFSFMVKEGVQSHFVRPDLE